MFYFPDWLILSVVMKVHMQYAPKKAKPGGSWALRSILFNVTCRFSPARQFHMLLAKRHSREDFSGLVTSFKFNWILVTLKVTCEVTCLPELGTKIRITESQTFGEAYITQVMLVVWLLRWQWFYKITHQETCFEKSSPWRLNHLFLVY